MNKKKRVFGVGCWAGAALAGLLALAGCGPESVGDPSGSYEIAKPEHPAMTSTASARENDAHFSDAPAGLPPGHPPIGGAAGAGAEPRGEPSSESGPIEVAGLEFEPPEGWVRERPANALRIAQFSLPPAEEGTEAGLVTVSTIGGSVEDNIRRWEEQQFEGGAKATVEPREVAGHEAFFVSIEGAYTGMGGGESRPDYRLLALIIPTPEGQIFFKATGPAATMERWRGSFDQLIRSFRETR